MGSALRCRSPSPRRGVGHRYLPTVTPDERYPDVRAGGATLYRLFDVGYEIDLDRAAGLLAPAVPARPRPKRGEASAIVTPRPPLTVELDGMPRVTAALFDFGVVSMRLRVSPPADLAW